MLSHNYQLLEEMDIDTMLVAGALDADAADISELSLRFMEVLIARGELEVLGDTHLQSRGKSIRDGFVNYSIALILEAMSWNDELEVQRALIGDVVSVARWREEEYRNHSLKSLSRDTQFRD